MFSSELRAKFLEVSRLANIEIDKAVQVVAEHVFATKLDKDGSITEADIRAAVNDELADFCHTHIGRFLVFLANPECAPSDTTGEAFRILHGDLSGVLGDMLERKMPEPKKDEDAIARREYNNLQVGDRVVAVVDHQDDLDPCVFKGMKGIVKQVSRQNPITIDVVIEWGGDDDDKDFQKHHEFEHYNGLIKRVNGTYDTYDEEFNNLESWDRVVAIAEHCARPDHDSNEPFRVKSGTHGVVDWLRKVGDPTKLKDEVVIRWSGGHKGVYRLDDYYGNVERVK